MRSLKLFTSQENIFSFISASLKLIIVMYPGYLQQNEKLMTASLKQESRFLKIWDSQLVTRFITVKFGNDVEAFYRAIRELQFSKMKCPRQNVKSVRGYISETVDLRGLPLSESTSEP